MNADEVQLKFDGMGISFLRQSSATTVHSKAVASLSVGPVARGPSANECISNIMDRFYCCNHAKVPGPVADVLLTCGSPGENRESRETNLLLVSKTCGTSRELSQGPRYTCEATALQRVFAINCTCC